MGLRFILIFVLICNTKIDLEKQISYWISGSIEDLESAKILIEKNRLLHGLFFCHLVIEKAIKANVVAKTGDIAPRSHNLIFLSEKAKLNFSENDEIFLGILMKYQLQGRYGSIQLSRGNNNYQA